MKVLHVAGINLTPDTGMGRISYEWMLGFERAGHQFVHVGLKELGKNLHPLTFGWHVRKYLIENGVGDDLILDHEPIAGFLQFRNVPLVVFSHGVEERAWKLQKQYGIFKPGIKSRLLPNGIRFFSNNRGYRQCAGALLSN